MQPGAEPVVRGQGPGPSAWGKGSVYVVLFGMHRQQFRQILTSSGDLIIGSGRFLFGSQVFYLFGYDGKYYNEVTNLHTEILIIEMLV